MYFYKRSSRYEFAHNKLRKFVINNAHLMFKRDMEIEEIDRIVNLIWGRCQRSAAEVVTKYDPCTKIVDLELDGKIVVLNMPYPVNNLEAYYVAIAQAPDGTVRYFVLENSDHIACVCELKRNGEHINYGFTKDCDRDKFINFVIDEFLNKKAVPNAVSCF